MSRTRNSLKNAFVSVVGQLAQVLLQFICRTVFIATLSNAYLGLSGLFSNVLSVLSLAELGFGTALIYSLYKPVSENDEKTIIQLLNLYKKIYRIIALVIVIAGFGLLPFLQFLIKDYDSYQNLENLSLIYILYLMNTIASYLYIYKKSVIDAYQKNYVYVAAQKGFVVLQNMIQMAVLLLTHNFIGYLLIQVAATVITNVAVSLKADRMFPYLKSRNKELPDRETQRGIFKNTAAMSMHKIGAVVVNSTDNLILSSMVSLASVGVYSNYSLIITNINGFIELVFRAVTASVGNLGVSEDRERLHEVFEILNFIQFWIYGFSSVCLHTLLNHFIMLWLGEDYVFSGAIVFVLVLNYYLKGMRGVINIYRDSLGLFWHDRCKPVFEALVNLAVSVILAKVYGIMGVFIGTAVSTITVCLWVEPYILYKYAFQKSMAIFFQKYMKYAVFSFCVGGAISYICSGFPLTIIGLICKMLFITLAFHLMFAAIFAGSAEWKAAFILMKKIVKRKI